MSYSTPFRLRGIVSILGLVLGLGDDPYVLRGDYTGQAAELQQSPLVQTLPDDSHD